ncbi:MAG: hypothetical protein JSV88_20195 [Candidatus Aminicenantes bacterium]|nr:MAG: hypothetical protein JSV88_20195 [Candidatus Aminicenantes bacterium]
MPREIKDTQTYRSKLLKLIPSEIVAAYMVLQGIIPEASAKWGLVIVSLVLLIITPIYLCKFENVKKTAQIAFSTFSFVIWIYSLGGPFIHWGIHKPWIGSIVLVLWTLLIPMFFKTNPE